MDSDTQPLLIGAGVFASVGATLFVVARSKSALANTLDEASRKPLEGHEYALVRGAIQPKAKAFQAEHSRDWTVAAVTSLSHRWSERVVRRRKRVGQTDVVEYGPWTQHDELIGQPVATVVPFVVVHSESTPRVGTVPVAVALEAEPEQLPLVLRLSKTTDEARANASSASAGAGSPVIINNVINTTNNNNNVGGGSGGGMPADGTIERRELGTLREERILPMDGKPLTVFGVLRRDDFGGLVVDSSLSSDEQPFIATFDTPAKVIADHFRTANIFKWCAAVSMVAGLGLFAYALGKERQ